jgi:hypothetical protein
LEPRLWRGSNPWRFGFAEAAVAFRLRRSRGGVSASPKPRWRFGFAEAAVGVLASPKPRFR